MTALLLLGPNTPMLFQGQEFAASAPFLYFADHNPELAKRWRRAAQNFSAIPQHRHRGGRRACLPNPETKTLSRCKLDSRGAREARAKIYRLHRDLLALRRDDPLLGDRAAASTARCSARDALSLRFFGEREDDRLLVVNLGRDLHLDPAPEPLLAPPDDSAWKIAWSSEDPAMAAAALRPLEYRGKLATPGHAAVVLCSAKPHHASHDMRRENSDLADPKNRLSAHQAQRRRARNPCAANG